MSVILDQKHPLYATDRELVNQLLSASPTDRNLADLARLTIRYQDFPGARDIQRDLTKLIQQWDYTTETLFAFTRLLHDRERVYSTQSNRDDWA